MARKNPDENREYARSWDARNPGSRAKSRDAGRSRTRKFLKGLKDVPCLDCGVKYPHYVMDFDHVHGEKSFNIARNGIDRKRSKLLAEIEKCEIVCANCHRHRTWIRSLTKSRSRAILNIAA